jgi:hypothetical protein
MRKRIRPFVEVETKISFADVHIEDNNTNDVITRPYHLFVFASIREIRHHYAYYYILKRNMKLTGFNYYLIEC